MSYYSTTHSTLLFNLTAYTTFLSLENASLSTPDFNVTTTLETIFEGPPSSPYNVTQKVIIAIVFTVLSFLTVMGNFMVSWTYNFIKAASMSALPFPMAIVTEEAFTLDACYSIENGSISVNTVTTFCEDTKRWFADGGWCVELRYSRFDLKKLCYPKVLLPESLLLRRKLCY